MMEHDKFYSDEEGDFVPLISTDLSSPETQQKNPLFTRPTTSFEIVSVSWVESNPSTKNKCLVVLAISIGCAGIALGYLLVRLGLSQMGDRTMPIELAMCHHQFNRTYQDVFLQISSSPQEFLCFDNVDKRVRCNCPNPLVPTASINQEWNRNFTHNQAEANRPLDHPYDVVFFGDSITAGWNNERTGIYENDVNSIHDVFEKHFRKDSGGKVEGVAFGIPGDRCSQLLYRLRNGELPHALQSKVFWVLIGINDLRGRCSIETMVVGIIQIAQEIVKRRPNSIVVLNSLLPTGYSGSGVLAYNAERHKIAMVNHWLECYAYEMERVEFFNATDIFLQPNTTTTVAEYYQDPVHPSRTGHAQWAPAIVDKVIDLIQTYQL